MHRHSRLALIATLLLLSLSSSGCALIYENQYGGHGFAVYSDRDTQFVTEIGHKVEHICDAYADVFDLPRRDLGFMTIVLSGEESNVVDYRQIPDVLGYYIPILNHIVVHTTGWPENEQLVDQILLHEIAHHFLVSEYPGASNECWLNEGLAGALEVTLHEGDHFEFPLFNPTLYVLARQVADANPDLDLEAFIKKTWSEFHDPDAKESHYALAWSIVYFVLEHHFSNELPLAERVQMLCDMPREDIAKLAEEWRHFLRGYDCEGYLLSLAAADDRDQRLTAEWALLNLGSLYTSDDLRVLRGLQRLFADGPTERRRYLAYTAFVARLERSPYTFLVRSEWIQNAVEEIRRAALSTEQPVALRRDLVAGLGSSLILQAEWVPLLIEILESRHASLRQAAARGLTRLAVKPTITNPRFWEYAPEEERALEVAEWSNWWRHRQAALAGPES